MTLYDEALEAGYTLSREKHYEVNVKNSVCPKHLKLVRVGESIPQNYAYFTGSYSSGPSRAQFISASFTSAPQVITSLTQLIFAIL